MSRKNPEYNISSVNPLYLLTDEIDRFVEEKQGSKYLNIVHSSNEVLKKYEEVWSVTKNCIHKINNNTQGEYSKDYMKIKFDSDDNLPLNKIPKFRILTIIIRNIFEKDGKLYPGIYLDDCLYECYSMIE